MGKVCGDETGSQSGPLEILLLGHKGPGQSDQE